MSLTPDEKVETRGEEEAGHTVRRDKPNPGTAIPARFSILQYLEIYLHLLTNLISKFVLILPLSCLDIILRACKYLFHRNILTTRNETTFIFRVRAPIDRLAIN